MNFNYENQGTNTYLVYTICEKDELDTMSLGMLTNNEIPGFASTTFTQMDTTKYIKFNVSSKVSVSQLFAGTVNKKRLIGVFKGIVGALISAEDYMLDIDNLILDLDYIFVDVSTYETVLICLPVANMEARNPNPQLSMFFKNIIFNTQFDQAENCDHIAKILNYINGAPVISLPGFKEMLEEMEREQKPEKNVVRTAQPVVTASASVSHVIVAPQHDFPATDMRPTESVQKVEGPNTGKYSNLKFGPNYPQGGQPTAPKKPVVVNKPLPKQNEQPEEKPMSMFYLLQHYSKENAAIYKAQQDEKKGKKNGPAPKEKTPVQKKQIPANPSFAVPGQKESSAPGYAIPGFESSAGLQQTKGTSSQPSVPKDARQPAYQQPVIASYQQPASPAKPISFGETTVLGGGIGETTVLGVAIDPNRIDPHLIRLKNQERIPLNKPVFRIGKEKSYVDYFVSDNTAISRSHANIINDNGEFYIVDTNSTNRTYVNGTMIQSNVKVKLENGMRIRLANEDFEFKMY